MKKIDYTNQVQKEALLNECKGNLFEFLVTQGLARKTKTEDLFLLNLPVEFKKKLSSYEELIRTHEPRLLNKLPELAGITVNRIWEDQNLSQFNFHQWNVIGKMVATNDNDLWNETDIVGTYDESGNVKKIHLSLKLTKDNSFINTKSAGAKSFLSKYFEATSLQQELNAVVDESFLQMGHKLYSMVDMDFKGSFGKEWSDHYSELPGELEPLMREVVFVNYHRVALKLHELLEQLKKENAQKFFQSLHALCGFGHEDIVQVNCFHQDYELKDIAIKSFSDLFSIDDCEIKPMKTDAHSVDILLGKLMLQVRVKPMNKFTTASYKINCSIKVRE